jgi:hypothetical protein
MGDSDDTPEFESYFEAVFGKGGPFESIFGKSGTFSKAFGKGGPKVMRHARSKARMERDAYQESLITELLITLAGKGLVSNAEAKDVIQRAKERAKQKTAEKTETTGEHDENSPCGGACALHDKRPHKKLECARCKKVTPHLIEGEIARCRVCITSRSAS